MMQTALRVTEDRVQKLLEVVNQKELAINGMEEAFLTEQKKMTEVIEVKRYTTYQLFAQN